MSRRDTIIIAVLINTGLLALLFMMAVQTESPLQPVGADAMVRISETSPQAQELKSSLTQERSLVATRDELDEVLKNHTKPAPEAPAFAGRVQETPLEQKREPEAAFQEPARQGHFVEVTVKRGDFLEKIAKANGVSVSAILSANRLSGPRLEVGQVLKIPIEKKQEGAPAASVQSQQKETAKLSSDPEYYTIKSGDNPWKIARQFHVRFDDLLKLNDLDENKARNLKPGDVLRVK